MGLLEIILLVLLGSLVGMLGAVFGIGGGILLIPAMVIYLHVPMLNAIATSLVTIIATSSAVAAINVEKGIANMRLGLSLEISTSLGALSGAFIASLLSPYFLKFFFALLVVASACTMFWRGLASLRGKNTDEDYLPPSKGEIGGEYFDPATKKTIGYGVKKLSWAMPISLAAGALSGMLGIGGGIIQVPLMHLVCGVPMKAAAATSNFMLGVTAATSAIVFFQHGLVIPDLTAVLVIGVLAGSSLGMKILAGVKSEKLQVAFSLLMFAIAVKMFFNLGG